MFMVRQGRLKLSLSFQRVVFSMPDVNWGKSWDIPAGIRLFVRFSHRMQDGENLRYPDQQPGRVLGYPILDRNLRSAC